jgi:hypothetical protein
MPPSGRGRHAGTLGAIQIISIMAIIHTRTDLAPHPFGPFGPSAPFRLFPSRYDISVLDEATGFERRFMGRMETGRTTTSDPAMGAGPPRSCQALQSAAARLPKLPETSRARVRGMPTKSTAVSGEAGDVATAGRERPEGARACSLTAPGTGALSAGEIFFLGYAQQ